MKVFIASGDENTACNCHPVWEVISSVVVANTKSEALGMLLEKHPDTNEAFWETFKELDTSVAGVTNMTDNF